MLNRPFLEKYTTRAENCPGKWHKEGDRSSIHGMEVAREATIIKTMEECGCCGFGDGVGGEGKQ